MVFIKTIIPSIVFCIVTSIEDSCEEFSNVAVGTGAEGEEQ
jgi:hypothetical protein